MTTPSPETHAGAPVIARNSEALPDSFTRGGEIPDDLDPLADGILMQHQIDWLEDKSDLKLAEKGRRTGITFAEALDDTIIAASARSAGGDNVFYIGDTKDKGREFIGYVAHFAKIIAGELHKVEEFIFKDEQPDGTTKDISAYRIQFASGFRVEALSSNPANIRGLQGVVVIDEAAFHRDVRAVIDAVNALLIWGGKVRVISTHNGVLNAFNELILEARAGKNPFKVHHIPFAAAVKNGLYRRVCMIKKRPWTQKAENEWEAQVRGSYGVRKAAMRQELDAIPAEAEGAALSRVQIEKAMQDEIPLLRWTCDDDFKNAPSAFRKAEALAWCKEHLDPVLKALNPMLRHVFGEDFARSGDATDIVVGEMGLDLTLRVPFIVEMRNVPFEQQRDVLHYLIERLPRFAKGALDKTGNGAYLAEVTAQKFGEKIVEVSFSREWYRTEMPPYVNDIGEGTVVLPKHDDVLQDHQALQYVDGIIKVPDNFRFKGSDGFNRHGDTAIAGALMHFASRQPMSSYGYHSARGGSTDVDDDDWDDSPRETSFRRSGTLW